MGNEKGVWYFLFRILWVSVSFVSKRCAKGRVRVWPSTTRMNPFGSSDPYMIADRFCWRWLSLLLALTFPFYATYFYLAFLSSFIHSFISLFTYLFIYSFFLKKKGNNNTLKHVSVSNILFVNFMFISLLILSLIICLLTLLINFGNYFFFIFTSYPLIFIAHLGISITCLSNYLI